ncbi:MAG: hypothetical protein EBV71_02075 [Chitinophagia bacterium]|jgi:tRNA_anti-like|nr:hypothetical protein [Chitinophagia bacterium]
MIRKNIRLISVVILLVVSLVAWYGYSEYNRKSASMADARADFTFTTITTLLAAFEKDEAGANKLYLDKVLEVEGAIKESTADEKGFYTITIGEDASLSSVRCSVDSLFSSKAAALQAGGLIKVRGICTGYMADELLGSDVTLVRCAIIEN